MNSVKLIALSKKLTKPLELAYNERMGFKALIAYRHHDKWQHDMTIAAMSMLPVDPLLYAYLVEATEEDLRPCRPNNFMKVDIKDKEFFLVKELPIIEAYEFVSMKEGYKLV